jgi:hypothetical protein
MAKEYSSSNGFDIGRRQQVDFRDFVAIGCLSDSPF